MNRTLIVQFCLVLAIAGSTVWLGEVWRNEGRTFVAEKEKQGGIAKERLVREAEKTKAVIIASYEAEGRQMRGLIEGKATGAVEIIRDQGQLAQEVEEQTGTRAQAYALETIAGIQAIADRVTASISDPATAQTVNRYLRRAAQAQDELRGSARVNDYETVGKEVY
jgi:hypothetical protein